MEQTLKSVIELTEETKVYLLSKSKTPVLPIKSLPLLNTKLWGLNRGRVVIVAGRTAMGKTALMTQFAQDISNNQDRTIYLSLEMPCKELIARNFCRKFKINNQEIEHGNFDKYIEKFDKFNKDSVADKIKYSDVLGANWSDIDTILNKMEKTKPSVVFIDHINHIKTSGINDKAVIDDYLTKLKECAIKHNITFVIGAQINRLGQGEKNPLPELHHLKGTGRLEEIADMCLLLFWPYYYDKSKPFDEYKIIIAKNRYGGTGIHDCKFLPQYSLFEEKQEIDNRAKQYNDSEQVIWEE